MILLEELRQEFNIPIPKDLEEIAKRMRMRGKKLYLVGGAVRDALRGMEPKDWDLATAAAPEKVIQILQSDPHLKIDLTGKSFGVVRVKKNGEEFEIATFRKDIGKGRRPDAVEWTGIEEDANRRDLTINALYYDLETKEIIDFVGGIEDIKNGVIRSVGDPIERFDEDRLRILRVARFAARIGSTIDPETKSAILQDNTLDEVHPERMRIEVQKAIKQSRSVSHFFRLLDDLDLMAQLFPGMTTAAEKVTEDRNLSKALHHLLFDNNIGDVKRVLKSMTYPNQVIDEVNFFRAVFSIDGFSASEVKKTFKKLKLTAQDLSGIIDPRTIEAFMRFVESPSPISARELMQQGLRGPELGQALRDAEGKQWEQLLSR